MSERHPGCPLDPENESWRLLRDGAELSRGSGVAEGLRKLWRATIQDSIDAAGNATGARVVLEIGQLGDRSRAIIHLEPQGNSVLLRLREWLAGAPGQVLLSRIAQAHANLYLNGERWTAKNPAADAESLALLTLASIMDEPETLARALKPGH